MSDRSKLISRLLSNRDARKAYIKGKLNVLIPSQIRALRFKCDMPTQTHLAKAAGMHQSRISTFETPGANLTIDTLARLAAALRVGLVVKFVPFSEMLDWDNRFSQDTFQVMRLDDDHAFLKPDAVSSPRDLFAPIEGRNQPVTRPQAHEMTPFPAQAAARQGSPLSTGAMR